VNYLITTFNRGNKVHTRIAVAPVDLDVTLAVPLGLIINEAVTNSLKYAFLADRPGTIGIELREEEKKQNYRLLISDDGVGFPAGSNFQPSRTLGMSMIRGLSEQIEGTLEINQQNGVQINVVFPAA
jgi:two-component sensor histidine kinase